MRPLVVRALNLVRLIGAMRILIALNEVLPPQQTGGSQNAALEIAAGLTRLGDEVSLVGRLDPRKPSAFLPLASALKSRKFYAVDYSTSIRTYRFFKEERGFPAVLNETRPDVVLVHAMSAMPIAHMISQRGIPLVVYWHDVEFHRLRGSPDGLTCRFVANSHFTSNKVRARFGRDATVIPPIFAKPQSSSDGASPRDRILFINPVPEKGVALALKIAALRPEIRFEFLANWAIDRSAHKALMAQLGELPNVTLTPRQSDMVPVYARARLLIVPSRWEEAWGRIATEAQANGVPVLATRIGGLSESVGPGGMLFDPDADASTWADAIEKLWSKPSRYAELVAAANTYSARPEIDPERNISRLRSELLLAIEERSR